MTDFTFSVCMNLRYNSDYSVKVAPVAQLDRVPVFETVGCGSDPHRVHLKSPDVETGRQARLRTVCRKV